MSATGDYLSWRREPHVGCIFARLIAGNPKRFDQQVAEVPSASSPERVAGTIARRVDKAIEDKALAAVALILPGLTTLERLARVMLALAERPHWSVTPMALLGSPAGDLVGLQVVREIPFGEQVCPSEALVLGPFDLFPPTRMAPVTALELFVGPPLLNDPKSGDITSKANLAHMDMSSGLQTPEQFKRVWDRSVEERLKQLGGHEDCRAKARVAFVIRPQLAQQLGCEP